ncbi:TlpA family protein disulfide reductase [Pseudotenacibaculum haliotis]|uniref:TlpA family protein disulfide reductase n=1 Tax=Pseudotenacibaculum haliotis TaxID=1862138 RepID=A0ABW5LST2_9FLAO
MKNTTQSFIVLAFLLFISTCFSQQKEKIYVDIQNIPKIQHKVSTGKYSYKTDKSPTVTYKLKNDPEKYSVKNKALNKSITQVFDHDIVYLKLRYNPGKYQTYVLQRGDSAIIEYSEGKPYIEVRNRETKKHDWDVASVIDKFTFPMKNIEFFNSNRRFRTKQEKEEEKKQYAKIYTQQVAMIDSLYKDDLLGEAEYDFYRKSAFYKIRQYDKELDLELLKKPDLHIHSYEELLNNYVFQNLKKKIISLGNGMARNSLESFDFTYKSSNFSTNNKNFLLKSYLKTIKIDFSKSTYSSRLKKYEALTHEKIKRVDDSNTKRLKEISKITHDVTLTNSRGDLTTLKEILDNNKGKIVYIDFWASWCGPCRQAFPAYRKIKETYKDKEIAFVFISGDTDPEKWEIAEKKEGLVNSFLATNYPTAKFYQDLKLSSFPRYLIFDASGKLITERAPGPNSDTFKEKINELLKQ